MIVSMSTGSDGEFESRARRRVGSSLADKYRLERLLGVGGMGAVYAATHRNGHRVAIKLLHPEFSNRADLRVRFVREGHTSNAVNHPGAVAVLDDAVAEDGSLFLVMELLDGQSVEDLWEENGHRLPVRTVLAIGRELCEVLGAAHRAGIVHRDVKPANLFVTRDGRLKVLDFGIARVHDAAAPKMTQTGAVFGTPAFMAPEQAGGRSSQLDGQTDLWGVGATMFTLLSGHIVHEGESSQHLAILAATEPARSLSTVIPDASLPLVALVDKALAFEKANRWPTADAMRLAICETCVELFGDPSPGLVSLSDTLRAAGPAGAGQRSGTLESEQRVKRVVIIGATTGQAVSSSTDTRLQRVPLGERIALRARELSADVARVWAAVHSPTVAPVSSSDTTVPQHRNGFRRRVMLMGVLAAAVGTTVFVARRRSSGTDDDTSPPSMVPSPNASALGGGSVAEPPAAGPPASAVPEPTAPSPKANPSPRAKPLARPVARPPNSTTRKPACPPYVLSPDGVKIWKPECL
jgi:serine/threonine-protein kinase